MSTKVPLLKQLELVRRRTVCVGYFRQVNSLKLYNLPFTWNLFPNAHMTDIKSRSKPLGEENPFEQKISICWLFSIVKVPDRSVGWKNSDVPGRMKSGWGEPKSFAMSIKHWDRTSAGGIEKGYFLIKIDYLVCDSSCSLCCHLQAWDKPVKLNEALNRPRRKISLQWPLRVLKKRFINSPSLTLSMLRYFSNCSKRSYLVGFLAVTQTTLRRRIKWNLINCFAFIFETRQHKCKRLNLLNLQTTLSLLFALSRSRSRFFCCCRDFLLSNGTLPTYGHHFKHHACYRYLWVQSRIICLSIPTSRWQGLGQSPRNWIPTVKLCLVRISCLGWLRHSETVTTSSIDMKTWNLLVRDF